MFNQLDRVMIHSLGSSAPGEYPATVCGVSIDWGDRGCTIYIVEPDCMNDIQNLYPYSHCTIPAACLRRIVGNG